MSDSRHNGRTEIVADGRWRLWAAQKKERVAIRLAVRQHHAAEMTAASPLRRILLEWQMLREIRAEMRRRFPSGMLHVTPLSR